MGLGHIPLPSCAVFGSGSGPVCWLEAEIGIQSMVWVGGPDLSEYPGLPVSIPNAFLSSVLQYLWPSGNLNSSGSGPLPLERHVGPTLEGEKARTLCGAQRYVITEASSCRRSSRINEILSFKGSPFGYSLRLYE